MPFVVDKAAERKHPAFGILKGFNHPAHGCALRATLGENQYNFTNPERVESIPHIPLIKFHRVAFQKLAEFILK